MMFSNEADKVHPLIAVWLDGEAFGVPDISPSTANGDEDGFDAFDFLCPQNSEVTLPIAREALFAIDPDCGYFEWFKCAAALKHQFSPHEEADAYEIFDEWSSGGTKYNGRRDTGAMWDSLNQTTDGRRPVTIATLLKMAKEHGWTGKIGKAGVPREPRIRFFAPSELRSYKASEDVAMVGDCHIMRGEVAVIGGEPGVGKSRAATALAVSGATGQDWLGLKVHRKFRTMIVQTENGLYRLKKEYDALNLAGLEDWIRVSEPPPFGLTLTNTEFQADIRAALESFKPDCVILDPWNAAARDDKQRDYAETFEALRSLLATGDDKPALVIVAHTRKPQMNERRTGGTGLMHLLAGSHMLASVPRSVFIMVPGSEDETNDTVLWFNPKNNNGEHAKRSAWHRTDRGFTPAMDFDWTEFEKPPQERKTVTLEHLQEVFEGGDKRLELNDAKDALAALVGITEGAAYNALKADKWAAHLLREGKFITFKP